MRLDTVAVYFEFVLVWAGSGTPAGWADGCQRLGLKWAVCERMLKGRDCRSGSDWVIYLVQCVDDSAQGSGESGSGRWGF